MDYVYCQDKPCGRQVIIPLYENNPACLSKQGFQEMLPEFTPSEAGGFRMTFRLTCYLR